MYLPQAYATDKERIFPALFVSNSSGKWLRIKQYAKWSEKYGFIIIGLNNVKNGPSAPIHKAQDLALKTLEARGVRFHSCLNFTHGTSGSGVASLEYIIRYPNRFAGVMIGIHNGNGRHPLQHQAISYYAGLKDEQVGWQSIYKAAMQMHKQGNPTLALSHPGGHDKPSTAQVCRWVYWMYRQTRLSHPALGKDGIKQEIANMEMELDEALKQPAKDRTRLIYNLITTPHVEKTPLAKRLNQAWLDTVEERFATSTDPKERMWLILRSQKMPLYTKLDRDLLKSIKEELKDIKKNSELEPEYNAAIAYNKVQSWAKKARSSKDEKKAKVGYEAIAQKYPDTKFGKKSALAASCPFLDRLLAE
jgi:hypothetical protein